CPARSARSPAQVHTSEQRRGARGDRSFPGGNRRISAVVLSRLLRPPTPVRRFARGQQPGRGGRVRNSELGRTGAVRPLWSEADSLRERVAEVENFGLRLVTEPDLELAEQAIGRLRKSCAGIPEFEAAGILLEDRVWSLVLHLRHAATADQIAAAEHFGSLAASEGLRLRRGNEAIEACAEGTNLGRAALGLLAGLRAALPVYVGAGDADEAGFGAVQRF